MDPGDSAEPSREELESRVAELEQTVSKMLPDRRGVLKGLGAAAIGGAAVGGATGGASGQSAAGQVGTESEPVDVEGAQGNFDSVNTPTASITELADHHQKIVTSDGDIIDPVDYADWGAAINAAREAVQSDSNTTDGWIRLPSTNGVVEFSTTIEVGATYGLIGAGGRGKGQGAATHLNYTGSGYAVDCIRAASSTNGVYFKDLRVDTDGASFVRMFRPTKWLFHNVYTEAPSSSNTAFYVEQDTGQSAFLEWDAVGVQGYKNGFEAVRTGATGAAVANAKFNQVECNVGTTAGTAWKGDWGACTWVNCITSDSDVGLQLNQGDHTFLFMFVEQARSLAVDLSNLDPAEDACVMVGGNLNPGQATSNQFDDPNGLLTTINTDGPGTRIAKDAEFLDVVISDDNIFVDDADGNGTSANVTFASVGNDNIAISNRNGEFTFRNVSAGNNIAQLDSDGNLELSGSLTENGSLQ